MTDMTPDQALAMVKEQQTVEGHIERMARAWPLEETRDRFKAIALSIAFKDPSLAECTPGSKLIALNTCCRLGLIPDPILGHIWLIPFRNRKRGVVEVQVIPGYKGFITLARRSGHLTTCETGFVHSNDEFVFERGTEKRLVHKPWWLVGQTSPGDPVAVWGMAKLRNEPTPQIEAMHLTELLAIKARSASSKRPDSPWNTDFIPMCEKSIVRKMSKKWSLSPEEAYLGRLDDLASEDEPQFVIPEAAEMSLGEGADQGEETAEAEE